MTDERRWPTYDPGPGGPETTATTETTVTTGPAARRGGGLPRLAMPVLAGALALGGGVLGLRSLAGGDGVPGFGGPDALSAEGIAQLRDDVAERTGDTELFRAVIYPEYAVLDVPVDATSQREESLQWDGDLGDFAGKGTASNERVDLAEVDPAVLLAAVAEAKRLVEDPTTWYAIVEGPSTTTDGDAASITAYATNDYNESGLVEVGLDGTEIRRYPA
ncbi:hypothetical protein [Nocardioides rubriscoriae]|uniref:hypothetical protein n=1 Tax=Nocardioides rubriscoriae TaxID=642762 RepID=UPI0011DFF9BC|nr:hypothetical protein [Nocardioides rubriscoriae]